MYARVAGKLRVKRDGHRFSLAHRDRIIPFRRDDFNTGSDPLDSWRTDENPRCGGLVTSAASLFIGRRLTSLNVLASYTISAPSGSQIRRRCARMRFES